MFTTRRCILAVIVLFLTGNGHKLNCQIQQNPIGLSIDDSYEVNDLVSKFLISGKQDNLQFRKVNFVGNPAQIGRFINEIEGLFFGSGILISTGRCSDAIGPNVYSKRGMAFGTPGNQYLEKITNLKSFDAAILEFEFMSKTDSISFEFFFGSEEYPEYVDRGINDAFAFLLENTEINEPVLDLSKSATGGVPITIDNINHKRNSGLFIYNQPWDPDNLRRYTNNPLVAFLSSSFEYDGFTVKLSAGTRIEPYTWYRISYIISDMADGLLDSGVFLKANSFAPCGEKRLPSEEKIKRMFGEFIGKDPKIDKGNMKVQGWANILFDLNSSDISSKSKPQLDSLANFLKTTGLKCHIIGYTDKTGTKEYNKKLSENRALSIYTYLTGLKVPTNSLTFEGKGEDVQISNNSKSKNENLNRRVEFIFNFN